MGRVRDESIFRVRLFNWPNVQIYLFHAFLLSFLIVSFEKYNEFDFHLPVTVIENLLFKWVIASFTIFILLIFKFIIVKYIGALFDLKSSANYYFFEYLRMSVLFFSLVFLFSILFMLKWPLVLGDFSTFVFRVFGFFLLIRFIVLFIRIGRQTSFKNLHLFSYLCATEILPVVVGLRYFLST